ncbi:conserved hypothetical protein [Ricinus communis]|uniref:Uncharacterized protein n=1 Tax=Ricinus communis TaxID=3988 RepID=B9SKS2_RICCO|nr:conserved hypothetical protein [Ricinus communis]
MRSKVGKHQVKEIFKQVQKAMRGREVEEAMEQYMDSRSPLIYSILAEKFPTKLRLPPFYTFSEA